MFKKNIRYHAELLSEGVVQQLATIIIIAVIAFIAIATYSKMQTNKKLFEEGKIIKRRDSFWEDAEIFTTTASYEDVREAVSKTDFSDSGVSITPDLDGDKAILFQSGGAWNAVIDCLEENGGTYTHRFYFPAWQTRNGVPNKLETMNVIMTSVEKMFLSLDPTVTVETRRQQVKTKSKLF